MLKKLNLCVWGLYLSLIAQAQLPTYLPQNGLVAWYPFNGNANDESGNGNNGMVNGASLALDRNGNSNAAYLFDGFNDYIQVLNSSSISIQGSFSTSFWMLMDGGGCNPRIMEINENYNQCGGYGFAVNGNSNVARTIHYTSFGNCTSGVAVWNSNNTITSLEWHHVVVSINGSLGIGKVYLDGNLFEDLNGTQIGTINYNNNPLTFGNINSGRCDWWGGLIDDIGIWNRTLTETEILALYSSTSPPCSANTSSLNITIPEGESYSFNGQYLTSAGTYTATLQNSAGCDSVVTLNLEVLPIPITCGIESSSNEICASSNSNVDLVATFQGIQQSNNECINNNNNNNNAFSSWTHVYSSDQATNIIKFNDVFYLRTANDVKSSNSIAGPYNSLGFATQINQTPSAELLGFDNLGRLHVATGWECLYYLENDIWNSNGLCGFGTGGQFFTKLDNGRIVISKGGFLRDIYYSDDNGSNWINTTNLDVDWNHITKAANGDLFACSAIGGFDTKGVIRSIDNGSSWQYINNTLNNIAGATGITKSCSNDLFIVGDRTLFKSTDNGLTWNEIASLPSFFNTNPIYGDLLVTSSNDIYYSGYISATAFGLFKSSNLGLNWEQITQPAANFGSLVEIDGNIGYFSSEGMWLKSDVSAPQILWSTGETTPSISVSPSETTTYSVTVTRGNQTCTSEVTITVNQPSASTVNAAITEDESYSFNGQSLTTAGTYTATLQNVAGCDSLVTLNLEVIPNIDPLICNLIANQIEVCAETPVNINIVSEVIQNICNKSDLPENLQAGLQGFFPFCENANDLSGYGNNAQINGAILSTDRYGNDNSAFYFDGENDYLIVETDATSSLSNLTALTISCWVKFDATNSLLDQGFVTKWNQSGFCGNEIAPSYWLGYHGADNRFIGATSNNGDPFTCVGTNGNSMTDWHHLVYTHNEEGENFYYDGVLAAQAPFNQLFCTTENPLIIGADINFGAVFRHFKGNIDDIFIYNRSLSQSEVNQLYGNSNSILWSTGETTPSISVSPTETTTYSVTVTQGNQTCTSDITITVKQPSTETFNASITQGESYSFNGQSLTTAGTFSATLQNAAGCDSTVTLNLSVVPAPPAGCYAATVVDFAQGLNSVGLPVEPARSHAIFSLGAPEAVVDGIVNFVSLGFGGSITLAFEAPVANGAGADIRIDEATWGINPCNRYPETADVFASKDGINFVYLGRGCQDMSLDLGALSWAQYIRIVDVSNILSFRAGSDGYDVNGIECLNGTANTTGDDGLVGCSLQEVISYTPGNRKNGTPVITSRRNPANALGSPQNNNTINFVSLGFGGTLVAKFDYVVFNQPGSDLRITETSFGNPSCTNYPEKARISMSLDNLNWVELGEICLDGEIDLGTLPYAQYLKIQDASPLSSTRFSGTADGFDVDAVVVLNNGCASTAARSAEEDNTTTADETPVMEAYPNPMAEETSIRFGNVQTEADIRIELFDASGRLVLSQNARIDVEQNVVIISTANLAKGMYHLVVNTGNESFRERLVK
jgi:hypothetical protein